MALPLSAIKVVQVFLQIIMQVGVGVDDLQNASNAHKRHTEYADVRVL